MSTFKKHVGRIKNTDRRCVVVYMQIPGNEDNALIVDTDALPDRFHDALMNVIDSTEGQQTPHLHSLLARRVLPDLNMDMMNALHTHGLLRVVEIDNVVMYPAPNAPCPLRTIVDFMTAENEEVAAEKIDLANRVLENQKADATQAQVDIAAGILRQAQDLEDAAAKKREEAYRLVPALRPGQEPVEDKEDVEGDCPDVTEASAYAVEPVLDYPAAPVAPLMEHSMEQSADLSARITERFVADHTVDLPDDVIAALNAAQAELDQVTSLPIEEATFEAEYDEDGEGNQVDTSDEAIQAFLDRAAYREDRADREKWEAMQPKKPVGRPRKDGLPAGTKPVVAPPAPKKRGRPPKAK